MLIQLTSTTGSAVLVNLNNIVCAAPAPSAQGCELWLTTNERLVVREDVAAISRRAQAAVSAVAR